ncbi:MAG: hypothetical protein JXA91_06655 [Candidatus Thermoplasmatota archaeon]|nr:hypothetical protein [Candidatus Thermoplasmatota archaeon]
MMKNLPYATFMNEVEDFIADLSVEALKKIIMTFAEKQNIENRNEFLLYLRNFDKNLIKVDEFIDIKNINPDDFLSQINDFRNRIENGEFFNEELNQRAYDLEDRYYWNRAAYDAYSDDEIDFSNEEYVLEFEKFLEIAKSFFRKNDIETSYAAFDILFDIINNREYYREERFVYGFSFETVLDEDALREYKTIFLRCHLIKCENIDAFKNVYHELINEKDILLSDLIEIDRSPLPMLDEFNNGFISFLHDKPKYDNHLVDVLLVKGGIDEIKRYAYIYGAKHPGVFLYYYKYMKEEEKAQRVDLLNIILEGIHLIPEKYFVRSYLALDLIEIAKKMNDNKNLLVGCSAAFYSDPTIRNLTYFIDFILSEGLDSEGSKLKNYLGNKKITKNTNEYFDKYGSYLNHDNIFSLHVSIINKETLIIGLFLLFKIEHILKYFDTKEFLGFSSERKYIAIITSLMLKSLLKGANSIIVDELLDHYCYDDQSDEYDTLRKLVENRAKEVSLDKNDINEILDRIELLTVTRVSHILSNKLRGGYKSSCLLLVAYAEVKQILIEEGDDLVRKIDQKYKKFSAFRKYLKDFTYRSEVLSAVR